MDLMPVPYTFRPVRLLLFLAGSGSILGGWGIFNARYFWAAVGFAILLLVVACILSHPRKRDCTILGSVFARPREFGHVPDQLPFE